MTDNPENSISKESWGFLFACIGFIFGFYLCRINNDVNNF